MVVSYPKACIQTPSLLLFCWLSNNQKWHAAITACKNSTSAIPIGVVEDLWDAG